MVDFVALSFLPVGRWRHVMARLRDGVPAPQVLEEECEPRRRWHRRAPSQYRERALDALERAMRLGLNGLAWDDPATPTGLRQVVDPPPVLWVRGCTASLAKPAVALVGSRAGTPYALAVAERLASDLVPHGLAIVSGLARGVDAAAHRGALAARGVTIAVLGCGADRVYPREHAALADEIVTTGAVVSEFAPGTPPTPEFFPRRNRIISALSRAVVVVEAGEKSGSLITARCALEQNRDVLAVPGNVLSGRNRGGHALLRDGARLVESSDDILEELGMAGACHAAFAPTPAGVDVILATLPSGEPLDLDEIACRSGVSAAQLLPRLLHLELSGLVSRVGGGRFVRLGSSC